MYVTSPFSRLIVRNNRLQVPITRWRRPAHSRWAICWKIAFPLRQRTWRRTGWAPLFSMSRRPDSRSGRIRTASLHHWTKLTVRVPLRRAWKIDRHEKQPATRSPGGKRCRQSEPRRSKPGLMWGGKQSYSDCGRREANSLKNGCRSMVGHQLPKLFDTPCWCWPAKLSKNRHLALVSA